MFQGSRFHFITIYPEIAGVLIEHIHVADEITLVGRTTSPTASCPSCGTPSSRVQSRYTRKLHGLPSSGRPVHLILSVRRFVCQDRTCAQKMFAERLPELCHSHAQRTIRLQEALCHLGLALGGQAGAEVGAELGLFGSRDTILRLVRHHPLPDPPPPRVIGLDDWAWKRRLRYGTLICESRTPGQGQGCQDSIFVLLETGDKRCQGFELTRLLWREREGEMGGSGHLDLRGCRCRPARDPLGDSGVQRLQIAVDPCARSQYSLWLSLPVPVGLHCGSPPASTMPDKRRRDQ